MQIVRIVNKVKNAYMRYIEQGIEPESVIILGPPGIGKTEMIRQLAVEIANETGKKFMQYDEGAGGLEAVLAEPDKYLVYVYANLNESMAEELIGIPRDEDGYVKYKPLLWARVCSKAQCVIHFDEITSVIDDRVKSAAMKIICERMVGYVKLSDKTIVIATGNDPESNSMANLLPAPFVNKASVYMASPSTVDEWAFYMNSRYGELWDARTYAYLKQYGTDFLRVPKEGETLDPYPTPRSWTKLAVYLKVTGDIDSNEILARVGKEVAAKFGTFLKMNVEPKELIANPDKIANLSRGQKYLFAVWLANNMTNDEKTMKTILNWTKDNDRELLKLVLLMMPNEKKYKVAMYMLNNNMVDLVKKLKELSVIRNKLKRG